ncbi:MAG: hypothetical protein AVO35_13330 [Candidatus Aegiribacteria sp. MLS_C]|jgi:cytochrome c-type biogenesis protein CcmH/NrfG|nr:MAG: hypothetical protein AVO35_13330 [Candidatus Aegiribacteria sp. MLS_C]
MNKIHFFHRKEKKLLEGLDRNPQDPENYIRLGKLYFLNSDYSKATEVYERGLKVAPRDISLLFNYAVTREAQQDLEGAKEMFLEILSIDPNHQPAQEHLDNITDF